VWVRYYDIEEGKVGMKEGRMSRVWIGNPVVSLLWVVTGRSGQSAVELKRVVVEAKVNSKSMVESRQRRAKAKVKVQS
jgi:hypothetical protein